MDTSDNRSPRSARRTGHGGKGAPTARRRPHRHHQAAGPQAAPVRLVTVPGTQELAWQTKESEKRWWSPSTSAMCAGPAGSRPAGLVACVTLCRHLLTSEPQGMPRQRRLAGPSAPGPRQPLQA